MSNTKTVQVRDVVRLSDRVRAVVSEVCSDGTVEVECAWFVDCTETARVMIDHLILGEIPTCLKHAQMTATS